MTTTSERTTRRRECAQNRRPIVRGCGETLFWVLLVSWSVFPGTHAQTPCTFCTHGPETTPFPDRQIAPDDQAPANTCGFLQNTVGFVQEGSSFCDGIRAVGTRCGCNIPPNACHFCWDESPVGNPDLELPDYPGTRLIPDSPPGALMSCAAIESYLHLVDQNDAECLEIQQDAALRCGCPPRPGETPVPDTNTTEAPVETPAPAPTDPPAAQCTLCSDGSAMLYPDKPVTLGELPIETCADLELFAGLLTVEAPDCPGLQAFGTFCGCPKPPDSCSFCPNGEPVPLKDQRLNWLEDFVLNVPDPYRSLVADFSCELMEAITASNPGALFGLEDALYCVSTQLKSSICGCSPGWLTLVMAWGFRCSGFLSLTGSLLIVIHVLRRKKNRFTTYHQLMLGISGFDCISSTMYMLSEFFQPREAGTYLALGNSATCEAQAVLIIIGQTSMYYNVALSMYYLLVICYNWKEHQFKRLHKWTHAVLITMGLGMAFGALPFVGPQVGICGLLEPPAAPSLLPVAFFVTAPIAVVLTTLTVNMALICWKVYRQQRRAQRWMAEANMALTRRVFWQSFWYILAFYLTLPYLIFSHNLSFPTRLHYEVNLAFTAILAPAQGFLNSLVYFQRSKGLKIFGYIFCCLPRWCGKLGSKSSATLEKPTDISATRISSTGTNRKDDEIGSSPEATDTDEKETADVAVAPKEAGDDEGLRDSTQRRSNVVHNDDERRRPGGMDEHADFSDEFDAVAEHCRLNDSDDEDEIDDLSGSGRGRGRAVNSRRRISISALFGRSSTTRDVQAGNGGSEEDWTKALEDQEEIRDASGHDVIP